jgi:hypothetical protein
MEIANQITDWISLLVIIVALITSFIYRKKDLLSIRIYIIVSFAFNFIAKIFDYYSENPAYQHVGIVSLNIFSLLEISILCFFLFVRIKRQKYRKAIIILFISYFTICIFFWAVKKNSFYTFTPDLIGIECLFLVVSCLFYIFEILNSDSTINLSSNANFIITCGILLYFSISVPSYFSWYNLRLIAPGALRIILLSNSLFYTILFFSIMKAYLCTIPSQKP